MCPGAEGDGAHPAICQLLSLLLVPPTCDPGSEGAAWDVLLVVLDQDTVVPGQHGKIGDAASPILVVGAADLCFGRALDGQGQAPYRESQERMGTTPRDPALKVKSPNRQAEAGVAGVEPRLGSVSTGRRCPTARSKAETRNAAHPLLRPWCSQ